MTKNELITLLKGCNPKSLDDVVRSLMDNDLIVPLTNDHYRITETLHEALQELAHTNPELLTFIFGTIAQEKYASSGWQMTDTIH